MSDLIPPGIGTTFLVQASDTASPKTRAEPSQHCLPGSPQGPPQCPTSVSGRWQQRRRGGKPGGSGSRVTPPRAPTLPHRLARAGLRLTGWKRKPGISQPLCDMQIIIIIIKKKT